jgi:hypothetical protein
MSRGPDSGAAPARCQDENVRICARIDGQLFVLDLKKSLAIRFAPWNPRRSGAKSLLTRYPGTRLQSCPRTLSLDAVGLCFFLSPRSSDRVKEPFQPLFLCFNRNDYGMRVMRQRHAPSDRQHVATNRQFLPFLTCDRMRGATNSSCWRVSSSSIICTDESRPLPELLE